MGRLSADRGYCCGGVACISTYIYFQNRKMKQAAAVPAQKADSVSIVDQSAAQKGATGTDTVTRAASSEGTAGSGVQPVSGQAANGSAGAGAAGATGAAGSGTDGGTGKAGTAAGGGSAGGKSTHGAAGGHVAGNRGIGRGRNFGALANRGPRRAREKRGRVRARQGVVPELRLQVRVAQQSLRERRPLRTPRLWPVIIPRRLKRISQRTARITPRSRTPMSGGRAQPGLASKYVLMLTTSQTCSISINNIPYGTLNNGRTMKLYLVPGAYVINATSTAHKSKQYTGRLEVKQEMLDQVGEFKIQL